MKKTTKAKDKNDRKKVLNLSLTQLKDITGGTCDSNGAPRTRFEMDYY